MRVLVPLRPRTHSLNTEGRTAELGSLRQTLRAKKPGANAWGLARATETREASSEAESGR